ncbi:bifunctional phosphopantothenoylcysteine decarboxylase/phosphopantothenate synthase [Alteripontixanthobacter maritimus]|nr:bifunctional phosphopantothenoylcysteine decarboxylase/phosphopantothenate synthase [Alteripontixanthobacter maritimus]
MTDDFEGAHDARMTGPKILLVIGGGIAAYKSCELVRMIRRAGGSVTCVLTEGGREFVTPMSLAALSGKPVYTTLWDLKDEAEMGHIELSREADLIVVCPATANMMAKMAAGIADDLASTLVLATNKPVMAVPAMNVRMWEHKATQRNVEWLRQAGVHVMQPDDGEMACGEFGPGRLPEPDNVWREIAGLLEIDAGTVGTPQGNASLMQAIEAEPEAHEVETGEGQAENEEKVGGFGGMLSSLIGRTTPRRSAEEIEAELEQEDFAESGEPAEWAEEAETLDNGETIANEDVPAEPAIAKSADSATDTAVSAGPLLAQKGAGRAAPPTDAEAINHTVHTGAGDAAPEPFAEEAVDESPESDPLWGQPDFDTDPEHRLLYGRHVLVTAGPTHEPIDPVRYIANRSSGKQGFSIAAAAAHAGARVTLVAGPVNLTTPRGVDRVDVESAREMADAVRGALPADIAVMVAAVADWRTRDYADQKMKKRGSAPPALMLEENPDILANVASGGQRPKLLVGFAAETQNVVDNARTKRKRKGADWIVANDVSDGVMGGDENRVHIVTEAGTDAFDTMPKLEVARALVDKMARKLDEIDPRGDADA